MKYNNDTQPQEQGFHPNVLFQSPTCNKHNQCGISTIQILSQKT